jgi:SnoaL-like domain
MNTDEARASLRALYEHSAPLYDDSKSAASLNDYQAQVLAFFGDDMVLHNPESTPWGGTLIGNSTIVAAMPGVQAGIGTRKISLRAVLIDGLHGLALVDLVYANDAGDTCETTVAEYFRFDDDGRVVEVIPHFFDTAAMVAFKKG